MWKSEKEKCYFLLIKNVGIRVFLWWVNYLCEVFWGINEWIKKYFFY